MNQEPNVEPDDAPSVIAFCGPNGSGKSTITDEMLQDPEAAGIEYINADAIAKSLEGQIPDYTERNMRAAELAEERRIAAMKERKPFAFETVMSTPSKVALMTQAKASGYTVALVFVTTNDPETNVKRVANRVLQGGHDVDPDTVRKRYHSAMGLLPAAVEHADSAVVFDNSFNEAIRVAAKLENGELVIENRDVAPWVESKLEQPYQARQQSRQEMSTIADQHGARMRDADASHGQTYTGKIVGMTDHHVLQKTGANVCTLHDRSLMATRDLQHGAPGRVEYAYDKGKIKVLQPAKVQVKDLDR